MTFISHLAQAYTNYHYMYGNHGGDTYTYENIDPALLAGVLLFMGIFSLLAYAVTAWFLSRIFIKAGVPAWIAWVPFYNLWKLLELGDQQGFWAVLIVVPFIGYVSLVFIFIAAYRIGLKFGKGSWWVLLAIFVPIVWLALLAFDHSKWHRNAPIIDESSAV